MPYANCCTNFLQFSTKTWNKFSVIKVQKTWLLMFVIVWIWLRYSGNTYCVGKSKKKWVSRNWSWWHFKELLQMNCAHSISSIKPGSLRRSRRLQLTTFGGDLSPVGPRRIWDGSPTYWICSKCNRIAQFLTILLVNMDRIVLLEYVESADYVHRKYFNRRQSPTTAGLPAKLNRLCVGDKCSHTPHT